MIITAVAITPESGVSTLCRRFQHCSRQRCLHCYAPWFVLEIFIELLTLKIIIELLWFEFVLKCKLWLSGSRWIWTEWIYREEVAKKAVGLFILAALHSYTNNLCTFTWRSKTCINSTLNNDFISYGKLPSVFWFFPLCWENLPPHLSDLLVVNWSVLLILMISLKLLCWQTRKAQYKRSDRYSLVACCVLNETFHVYRQLDGLISVLKPVTLTYWLSSVHPPNTSLTQQTIVIVWLMWW